MCGNSRWGLFPEQTDCGAFGKRTLHSFVVLTRSLAKKLYHALNGGTFSILTGRTGGLMPIYERVKLFQYPPCT
jgi:hypothetical protein